MLGTLKTENSKAQSQVQRIKNENMNIQIGIKIEYLVPPTLHFINRMQSMIYRRAGLH